MRPDLVRTIVVDVFSRVTEQGELADRALHRALHAHKQLHSSERRFVSTALYAMIRHQRRHEFLIDAGLAAMGQKSLGSRPTPEIQQLRFAAALVSDLSESVDAAITRAGLARPMASALARVTSGEVEWPKDPAARLTVQESLPGWVARQLLTEYGDQAAALARGLNGRAPLTLRANTLKTSADGLIEALAREGVASSKGALSPWAVILAEHHNVFGLAAYKAGLFDIQDEGSQIIAMATAAGPGQKIIDACCGAGGKTLALAAMMQNKGLVVACDIDERRMKDLRPRAALAGAFNLQPYVVATGRPGDKALKRWLGRADVVLVDAPCSGSGAWRRHPDARARLDAAEVTRFAGLQGEILRRYAACVKPGGRLIYATCSIFTEENERVADAFAGETPSFEALPLTDLPAQTLNAAGRVKVLPHLHGTDGFFAAAFRRKS